ncbi:helix-turn-helix domain-containing protein [Natrialba aegyptia]|uniref:Bacterio-opsin activator HTH domain-containing protein n=1 Tax=Natrialba aegyptia DSM 13077 TaxID=1227491 RepID=M0BAA4_9EURY|nr:helix-turn-helix domain-containing protein [Natrialba aegyptia]ELZ07836.1 bacterio-opsin activator HTH domain-containing protein [Natrialba aegyptia DSM 13077]
MSLDLTETTEKRERARTDAEAESPPASVTASQTESATATVDTGSADHSGTTPAQTPLRTQADGGVIAQLRLEHEALLLRPTLRRALDTPVELEYRTQTPQDRTVVFLTVYGTEFEPFDRALAVDPTVTDPVLVDRYSDRRVYRVTLTDRALALAPMTTPVDGHILDITSSRDGWLVQLRFPDRDALVEFNDTCRARGVSVAVEHLRVSDDEDDGVVALTEKQQELLLVAYQEGYFDVPRGISQDELADRLDVSKSAVSQRLRRAIGELCGATIA